MISHTPNLLYYILAETIAIDEAIVITMPAFITKTMNIKNKHLLYHTVNLINNLKLLQSMYFKENILMLIVFVNRFLKQACAMSK